jgi:cysteinyl-tRNA synthetase
MEYLGETVDIHGGGQDLVFPHHENELAQSEAYTQKTPFARHWVHNGLLHMGEDKMSKSLGNLVAVSDALQRHTSDAFRLLFLSTHYTHPQTYSEDNFNSMERGAERLRTPMRQPANENATENVDPEPYRKQFLEAMDSDLNTPQALAALFDLGREINRASEEGKSVKQAQETLSDLSGLLGLTLQDTRQRGSQQVGPFVELLLGIRGELRTAKEYALADSIRSGLSELGISLEDTPQGTEWRYANIPSPEE